MSTKNIRSKSCCLCHKIYDSKKKNGHVLAAFNLLTMRFSSPSFMFTIAGFPEEYLTSVTMVSLSRMSTYTSKKLANMKHASICKASRTIDLYKI